MGLDGELLGRLNNEDKVEGRYVYGQEQTFQCSGMVHIKLGAPYMMKTFLVL